MVTSDASEQTAGDAPVMHDVTVMPYDRPGKSLDTMHSFWTCSEPSLAASTKYESLFSTSSAGFWNPTVMVLSVLPFIAGAPNSLMQLQCFLSMIGGIVILLSLNAY